MLRDSVVYNLRRRLLARGLRPAPTCPTCHREVDPKQWGAGAVCAACEAQERADYHAASLRDELNPDGTAKGDPLRYPMVDDGFDFEVDA